LEVVSTNYLLICAEDRAAYTHFLKRLKRMRELFSKSRKTIRDSHALFDRIRIGPAATRKHWLKCKSHWFTSPESARLYQAEVEIARTVGDRPLKRWWKETDDRSNLYRVDFIAEDLHFTGAPKPRILTPEMEEWAKTVNPYALEQPLDEESAIGGDDAVATTDAGVHHLPGAKDTQGERKAITQRAEESLKKSEASGDNNFEAHDPAFDEVEPRLFPSGTSVDDTLVANAFSIVREIAEVCTDDESAEKTDCVPGVAPPLTVSK